MDYQDFDSVEHAEEYAQSLGYSGAGKFPYAASILFACMSQILTLEKIANEEDYCLYLEDDIDLLYPFEDIVKEFDKVKSLKPNACHIVSWNHPWDGDRISGSRVFKANHANIDTRSFAVIFSPEFAASLAKNIKSLFIPLDSIYNHIKPRDKSVFFFYPFMALENETALKSTFHDINAYFFKKKFLSNLDKKEVPDKIVMPKCDTIEPDHKPT